MRLGEGRQGRIDRAEQEEKKVQIAVDLEVEGAKGNALRLLEIILANSFTTTAAFAIQDIAENIYNSFLFLLSFSFVVCLA